MDPIQHHASTGIERLERELIVLDFTDLVSNGAFAQAASLLHDDVIYRPSPSQHVEGRAAVIGMCVEIREAFEHATTELVSVAVSEQVVLAEQVLRLKLRDQPAQTLMGFASYRIGGFQIVEWRQLLG